MQYLPSFGEGGYVVDGGEVKKVNRYFSKKKKTQI